MHSQSRFLKTLTCLKNMMAGYLGERMDAWYYWFSNGKMLKTLTEVTTRAIRKYRERIIPWGCQKNCGLHVNGFKKTGRRPFPVLYKFYVRVEDRQSR
jgi:hypothetical protein